MIEENKNLDLSRYKRKLSALKSNILYELLAKLGHKEISKLKKRKRISLLLKNYQQMIIEYCDLSEKLYKSKINKSLFLKTVFEQNEKIKKYDIVKADNWIKLVFLCYLSDISKRTVTKIIDDCRIIRYKNKQRYKLKPRGEKELDLKKLEGFISNWNEKKLWKIHVTGKQNNGSIRFAISKEIGIRNFRYFINRENPDKTAYKKIFPVERRVFEIEKGGNNIHYITFDFNFENQKGVILELLKYLYGCEVSLEKDYAQEISEIEKKIKKSTNCRELFENFYELKRKTNENIIKGRYDQETEKRLLKIAETIQPTGIYIKDDKTNRIDKFDIEGDLEYLQSHKPGIIDSINGILVDSKNYEIKIDINNKKIGIKDSELKKPLGNLSQDEETVIKHFLLAYR